MSAAVAARPIRPLPKRRLRERLSESASARFSPPQPPSAPLFFFPFNSHTSDSVFGRPGSPGYGDVHGVADGLQDSSDDEDNSNASVSRGAGVVSGLAGGGGGADPYEWTENTNNKKKRKIPMHTNPGGSSGSGGTSGCSTSPGFSPTSASPRNRWKPSGIGAAQRSPLSARRVQRRQYPASPSPDPFARAASAEPGSSKPRDIGNPPVTPTKSRPKTPPPPELSPSGVPKRTQFTFVCESPMSASLSYAPGGTHHATPSTSSSCLEITSPSKSMHTVGTQTSPKFSDCDAPGGSPPNGRPKKPKKLSRRELFAREQRRRRQELLNSHHSNNNEIWICEFCEYESIFGTPPLALMQQYEIKDRKERRRLAEKRRLLEKAKQKGKKNVKGGKSKAPNGTTTGNTACNGAPPPPPPSSEGTQSDDVVRGAIARNIGRRRHSAMVQTDECLDHHHHHPPSCGRGANGACCVHGGGGGHGNIHQPA
ncbi:hypothetical protein EX30DRAFT_367834 [Ascodesmis nigricans]|uniref:Uncharacterized protein n=1 Tax=Ascodesmis nigricans TaxID=341454 RepID=A0A4S2N5W0_9PEZI|nr:hypothetical protein EX30DRAFT_367834 [Ascodesmis nigricans]